MTFETMKFELFRGNSYGYGTPFKDRVPFGYGSEVDFSEFADRADADNLLNDCANMLNDRACPLYRAADKQLYKVVVGGNGAVRVWARALLLPDKAERLKEFREANGFTLKQVEQASGIPFQSYGKWEKGDRDIANASGKLLLRLADALSVEMEELVR